MWVWAWGECVETDLSVVFLTGDTHDRQVPTKLLGFRKEWCGGGSVGAGAAAGGTCVEGWESWGEIATASCGMAHTALVSNEGSLSLSLTHTHTHTRTHTHTHTGIAHTALVSAEGYLYTCGLGQVCMM